MTRLLRALVGFGALVAMVLVASGCASSSPAAAPTPDPFAGLADRSDQAFRQGLEAYGQGQYRDALTDFEQAKTLSPSSDPLIDQMIERTKSAMAPTPTAVPPTPTEVPATPTAVPVALSQQQPDTDLGQRYFGNVSLAVVPGSNSDAPAATQFFFQDQVGLHIDGLKQHLRLPFSLRVFNADSKELVASVSSEDASAATPQTAPTSAPTPVPAWQVDPHDPTATPTSAPVVAQPFQVARFWDSYVWYHTGGEQPGRYHLELYANGVLTNTFDYSVGTVPVPTPAPTQAPTVEPTAAPTIEDVPPPPPVVPTPVPPAPRSAPSQSYTAPEQPAPTAVPATPTPIPTPATAYTTTVGGIASGLDVDSATGRFYLVDSTGVIWVTDAPAGAQRPTLGTPINIGQRQPVDLAIDQSTGYLYVSSHVCEQNAPGCIVALNGRGGGAILRSIALPGAPSQLRVDSDLGLLYVAVPDKQALIQVDVRSGNVLRTISGLPQVTALALDSTRHTLYAAHLGGQVTVIDVPSAQVIGRPTVSGAGLNSIATARGLVYGVNTATHELDVLEPMSQAVARYPLSQEPAAIAAAEDTGAIYVLSSRSDVILQMDPTSGTEIGRVNMASRGGHMGLSTGSNLQALQPRLVLDPHDDAVFASLPDQGELAAITNDQFPTIADPIPYVQAPEQPVVASIPGVIWPGGDAGPAQPAPILNAQAPDSPSASDNTDQEGL
ncbi:MAG: hypothetical protein JO020_04075 [Chloroflexi bacterium]|nr:hypothetical protein [Chloroflexota bacterium]